MSIKETDMPIELSKLMRMPSGTVQRYDMYVNELPYFLKKMSTYAMRANAKIDRKVGSIIWDDSDTVSRIVVIKIIKSGQPLKARGRKVATVIKKGKRNAT